MRKGNVRNQVDFAVHRLELQMGKSNRNIPGLLEMCWEYRKTHIQQETGILRCVLTHIHTDCLLTNIPVNRAIMLLAVLWPQRRIFCSQEAYDPKMILTA